MNFIIKVNVKKQRRFDRSTVIFKLKSKIFCMRFPNPFQLENDRRTVETSLFFNANFYVKSVSKNLLIRICETKKNPRSMILPDGCVCYE